VDHVLAVFEAAEFLDSDEDEVALAKSVQQKLRS